VEPIFKIRLHKTVCGGCRLHKQRPKPHKTDRILYKNITIYYIKSFFLPNKIGCHSGTFFRTSRRHPGRHRPQPITYGKGGNLPSSAGQANTQATRLRPRSVSDG
jgi:hypothetical protein